MSQNAAVATSRRTLGVLVPVALLALIIGVAAEPALADTCEDLQTLSLPHTTIALAQSEPAGTFAPPVGPPLTGLPAFCRVVRAAHPTAASNIGLEVWIPAGPALNGQYLLVRHGAFRRHSPDRS